MIKGFGKFVRQCVAAGVLATGALMLAPAAHAESVNLLSMGGQVRGTLGVTQDLAIQSAGKLTVEVFDLGIDHEFAMFQRLQELSFSVSRKDSEILGSRLGEGGLVLDIGAAGLYSLNISAFARDRIDGLGSISYRALFEPLAPVPLPAGVWLLLSGLAWATGLQRKRAKLAANRSEEGSLPWGRSLAFAH